MAYPLPDSPVRPPTAEEGNPLFPLPPDYEELTREGSRQARVNACSLCRTGDPLDFVWAWAFFRQEYLFPLPEGRWYDVGRVESPPEHYQMVYALAAYRRNILIFPRIFAKSTIAREVQLLQLLAGIAYLSLSLHSHNDYVKASGGKIRSMLTGDDNPFIAADFGPLKPKKGVGEWGAYNLHLTNGNKWFGRSIMGKLPGARATEIFLDDAEFDQQMRIAPQALHEQVDKTVGNYILPMLRGGYGKFHAIGTFHTRKFWIYHAATCDPAEDDRFTDWHKMVYAVEDEHGNRLWGNWYDDEFIEERKAEMSAEDFGSQYMNRPGDRNDRAVTLHPKLSFYSVPKPDEAYHSNPLASEADLVSWRPVHDADYIEAGSSGIKPERVVRPFGKTVSKMYRLLVADPIREPSFKSDHACVMVVGIEHSEHFKDTWYYLDMRVGKVPDATFIDWIWELGCKWRVRVCGIEAISTQKKLAERAAGDFAERSIQAGWAPRIYPIRYDAEFGHARRESKGKRISRVVWRYEQHRMKLPIHLVRKGPPWAAFRSQLEDFTEDLRLLPHDDIIDTSVMPAFMLKPKGTYPSVNQNDATGDFLSMIRQGIWRDPDTKQPLLAAFNMQELPADVVEAMEQRRFEKQDRKEKEAKRRGRRLGRPTRGRRMVNYA